MIRSVTVDIDRLVLDRGMSRWERAALAEAVADELGRLLGVDATPMTPAGGSTLSTDIAGAIHAELSTGAIAGFPAAGPAHPLSSSAGRAVPDPRASRPTGGHA